MEEFLDTEAAAAYIAVEPETLRRLTRRREIAYYDRPGWRSYRYRIDDLKAWIDAGRVNIKEQVNDKRDSTGSTGAGELRSGRVKASDSEPSGGAGASADHDTGEREGV